MTTPGPENCFLAPTAKLSFVTGPLDQATRLDRLCSALPERLLFLGG